MPDRSLLYRPRSRLLTTVNALMGGPSPSSPDDPGVRFGPEGVVYYEVFRRGPVTQLAWDEVRAVALLPGPVAGRRALCVYPWREPPEPDIAVSELFTGSGAGLGVHLRMLFGTPYAVHWHHVRGPSPQKLSERVGAWTGGRVTLRSTRPV